MGIKSIIVTVCTCLAALCFNANAALIDNDAYTSDDISGLDWLDLSITSNMTYSEALSNNSGWRYATNAEVENLFTFVFVGYYDTDTSHNSTSTEGAYANQLLDTEWFESTIGPANSSIFSLGLYIDEDSNYTAMGTYHNTSDALTKVYSIESSSFSTNSSDFKNTAYGSYLVRASVVPIPAAVWLFGSGLIGLIGFARREKV